MTFILSCATHDAVYQVSDRRLTWLGGPDAGTVKDDESNKAVLIDGRMAFGYTGIAEVEGTRTDYWLAQLFGHVPTKDLAAVAERIRQEATSAFRRTRVANSQWLRHAFVGVGWGSYQAENFLAPFLVTITNALDAAGEWEYAPSADFRFVLNQWGATVGEFAIASAGQSLAGAERKAIWRHVRRVVRRDAPRRAMLRALIDSCLWVAGRYATVGKSLMVLCIPRSAVERQFATGEIIALTGPPGDDFASFLYLREGGASLTQYGPHFAAGGSVMTDFSVSPL